VPDQQDPFVGFIRVRKSFVGAAGILACSFASLSGSII